MDPAFPQNRFDELPGVRAAIAIQARVSSSRLPGKVLADLAGKPLILRLVERLRRSRHALDVVVLTSTDKSDDPLAEVLDQAGVPYRRGSLTDVLERYVQLADELNATHLVRVTGDCPLASAQFADLQIEAAGSCEADFVALAHPGASATLSGQNILSAHALQMANRSSDPRDREHVGSFYFLRNRQDFRTIETEVDPRLMRNDFRLCVDEDADLERMRELFEHFEGEWDSHVPMLEVVQWIDAHPGWREASMAIRESTDNVAARDLGHAMPKPAIFGRWTDRGFERWIDNRQSA